MKVEHKRYKDVEILMEEVNKISYLQYGELPGFESLKKLRAEVMGDKTEREIRDVNEFPNALGDNSWEG